MNRLKPINLCGPRAYITDFDYNIVRFKPDRKIYSREVERRLKVNLLTKGIVVCAASHLNHKFSYDFIKNNSLLLEENLIVPALRSDKRHITDYYGEDRGIEKSLQKSMKDFYDCYVSEVVEWELMENASWFKRTILKALKDEGSVIRRNLTNISLKVLNSLLTDIERTKVLNHEIILECTSTWPIKEQTILLNFVNLVYQLSGARVVNCESALPQENYIDYSLADFSKHRAALSDTQVFLKIFFELAFKTLNRNCLSADRLDDLSFEDIQYLRTPIEESSFRKKYDELIQKSIQTINQCQSNPDNFAFELIESLEISEQISKTFEEIFEQELPEFVKKKYGTPRRKLYKSTLSLAYDAAEFHPIVGPYKSAINLTNSIHGFFVNLNQSFKCKNDIYDYKLILKEKEKLLRHQIENTQISNKSVLLDTLDLIIKTISTKNTL